MGAVLTGEHALITGGAGGMGAALAKRLAGSGIAVAVADINESAIEDVVAEIRRDDGTAEGIAMNVGDPESVANGFASIQAMWDGLDYFVYCAGVMRQGALVDLLPTDWDTLFAVNATGPFLTCQRAAQLMLTSTGGRSIRRKIVIISSVSGIQPKVGSGGYAASKSVSVMIGRVMAAELAAQGVNVNVLAPGPTETAQLAHSMSNAGKATGWKPTPLPPLGRIAQPDEMASAIEYLLSADADFVNGAVLTVDGGLTAVRS